MSNTSATGGYLLPLPPTSLPDDLTFEQFIQQVFVGVSGLPGNMVRPSWQINPPKQPDVDVNWLALHVVDDDSDTNAYTGVKPNGDNVFQRMEQIEVQCSFYGPAGYDLCKSVRDSFQIPQNMEGLKSAGMAFAYTEKMNRIPDLVNERWVDRWTMSVFLRREILRTYRILNLVSVSGTLNTMVGSELKTIAFHAEEQES